MNRISLRNKFNCLLVAISILLSGCASESTSWLGQGYNNITSHFNGYYYSREEIAKIERTILKSQTDDFNRILKIFPALDSTIAKGYDKDAQESIKMASLAIQHHPHSKWVDDCYILVGKARLYTLDWGNAIQTFKYVNTKSKDPSAKHQAIIQLVRTFTEHKEFNNAQAAIDYLLKEKLDRTNFKNFYLQKAYYHQTREDYDNMVRSLTKADSYLTKKDRHGRIYFIIGQVYQKLGFESEAYIYYKKCLSTNPEYEVDFYARLYMAQVTEISRNKDVNSARRSFKKLLKDSKNKEFKDKIYFEMGLFEFKQKNLNLAIANYNQSIRIGTNKRIDGEAYLKLGEINYDTLKNYETSQAYYDSALRALPKDFEGYGKIKARAEILDEFVKNLKTIHWQDSLLAMANLDSVTLRKRIDSVLTIKKELEAKRAKKNRKSNRINIENNTNTSLFETNEDPNSANTAEPTSWYFANPSASAIGVSEFNRVWGTLKLEDNWRRSARSSAGLNPGDNAATPDTPTTNQSKEEPVAAVDPVDAEFKKINLELPKTEEQKKVAYKKIEDAYYNLGDIYYYKLLEGNNAIVKYNKLLERFPDSEYAPEVLYKMYLISKEINPMEASVYATRLKEKYPNSTFAKILINPNYLKENSEAAEKQKAHYKNAYQYFEQGDYAAASRSIGDAEALGQTIFSSNLDLLKILIIGKTEDISKYQYMLDEFIKANPDRDITPYAKKLLETSKEFKQSQEKQKGIAYIKSFEESHYFVILSLKSEKIDGGVSALLEDFNTKWFKDLKLNTSSLMLNDEYVITLVTELPRITSALEYYKTFNENLPSFAVLQDHKISNFVITKDNFDIFYRTKGLDEYIKFFKTNYHPENQ